MGWDWIASGRKRARMQAKEKKLSRQNTICTNMVLVWSSENIVQIQSHQIKTFVDAGPHLHFFDLTCIPLATSPPVAHFSLIPDCDSSVSGMANNTCTSMEHISGECTSQEQNFGATPVMTVWFQWLGLA